MEPPSLKDFQGAAPDLPGAACKGEDPNMFFPLGGERVIHPRRARRAKAVCAGVPCPGRVLRRRRGERRTVGGLGRRRLRRAQDGRTEGLMSMPETRSYVTEIDCQPAGNGVLHSLHLPMREPEPLPEPEPEAEP